MSNLTKLIHSLIDSDFSKIDEKSNSLRLRNIPLSLDKFNLMKQLKNVDYEKEIHNVTVTSEEIQIDIDLAQSYNDTYHDVTAQIKIDKSEIYGLRFFFEKGFEGFLIENPKLEDFSYISLDFIGNTFNSLSTVFDIETSLISSQNTAIENVQAIKYTKALSTESQKFLPSNVLAWISKNLNDVFPNSWQKWSALKLFCSLCSEIYSDNKIVEFYFRGERRKKITFELKEYSKLIEIFAEVSECADWVFHQSKDIDTRHYLFNHQMTLVLSEDEKLQDIVAFKKLLKTALDNAQLAYRYHLQSSSKELTKTLTDLNKTLFEYVGKIRQNAADLVNGLWRDLTTVIGLLLLNFALKKPDVIEKNYDVLGFGLCAYLIISIVLNARMGFWFFSNVEKGLNEWRIKIYSYLNNNEFEQFAQKPLNEAFRKYKSTFWIVVTFYVLMITAVANYTFWDNVWNWILTFRK